MVSESDSISANCCHGFGGSWQWIFGNKGLEVMYVRAHSIFSGPSSGVWYTR